MGPPMLGFPIFGFLIFMLPIFMLPVFLLPMLVNFLLPIFGFLMLDFPIWVSNLYASNLCASNSWVSKFCTYNSWASNICVSNAWFYKLYQPSCLQYLGFQHLLFQTALPLIFVLAISANYPISAPMMATISAFLHSMDDSRKENYSLRSSWRETLSATDALFVIPLRLVSMPTALALVLVSFAVE